jgi:hypothetical protein
MNTYCIGFRSGEQIKIKVNDGVQLVKDISEGMSKAPGVPVQWFCEPGLMLNLSEVCYVLPESSFAASE